MNIYDYYTDGEPIGMDHPLFMVRTQSRIDAGILFAQGLPLADAIRATRERMKSLFAEVPLALIDATVTATYANHERPASGSIGGVERAPIE